MAESRFRKLEGNAAPGAGEGPRLQVSFGARRRLELDPEQEPTNKVVHLAPSITKTLLKTGSVESTRLLASGLRITATLGLGLCLLAGMLLHDVIRYPGTIRGWCASVSFIFICCSLIRMLIR